MKQGEYPGSYIFLMFKKDIFMGGEREIQSLIVCCFTLHMATTARVELGQIQEIHLGLIWVCCRGRSS